MTVVVGTTPLVYLARSDRLGALERVGSDLLVPGRAYDGVVAAGMEAGGADAKRVEEYVQDGVLQRRSVEATEQFDRLVAETELTPTDAAVLHLADEADGIAVLDEGHARRVADAVDVGTRSTAYLVLLAVERGDLSADEARDAIDAMLDAGWHCSPDLYAQVLRKLDELAPR